MKTETLLIIGGVVVAAVLIGVKTGAKKVEQVTTKKIDAEFSDVERVASSVINKLKSFV